ncbi:hypothetical protein [Labrenzia sp. CE80]|uniref:hypothetical protein n=1 Tax=Labrenzia sp. CE80 TaxID=1788986 RepID=UPI00129AF304|nr:hypothetical protein [Labrenzia sp. CE80]
MLSSQKGPKAYTNVCKHLQDASGPEQHVRAETSTTLPQGLQAAATVEKRKPNKQYDYRRGLVGNSERRIFKHGREISNLTLMMQRIIPICSYFYLQNANQHRSAA